MKRTLIVVTAAVFSSPLWSQQNPTDSSSSPLEEVIVTANKISQKQNSTAKIVQVINRATLEQNAGRSLAQVLNEQSGLFLSGSQNNPGTVPNLYLRGAGSANTLILIDGMPVTDASGISIEFDINHFAVDQIERIEILKGAQSTLYGSDAVAGVINIITRKNVSNRKLGVNGQFSAGSFNTYKANLGVSGQSGKVNYSAQYNRFQSKGFSSATDASGADNFDKDGQRQNMINLAAGLQATANWKLQGYYQYSDYKTDLDDAAFSDDKNRTAYNRQQVIGIKSILQLPKGQFVVHSNYNRINRDYRDPVNVPAGPSDFDPSSGNYKGNSFFAEAYLNSTIQPWFSLLGGVDYRRNQADIVTDFGGFGSSLSKDSLEASMMSAYISGHLHKNNRFGIELGGRFTQHQDFGDAFTYSVNPYYSPIAQLKIFASAGSAFRAPSVYNLASEYGNTALAPERSTQQELGVQYNASSNRFFARATYFNRNIKDIILFAPLSVPPFGQYQNGDKQSDHGIELELRWKPVEKISLSANYTFVDGKLSTSTSNGKDTSYFNLYRRPKHSFNINGGYQLTSSLFIGIHYRWVDKRQDLFYNSNTFSTELADLKHYYNLDLYAKYQLLPQLTLYTDLRNITDQEYFDVVGYNARKFNIMAGVIWKW
ncbi:TonB-dependent receptor [Flavihumibacter cheonanensis]|uniref:TonB-dependent receptor plug domain-containing protein n=1 Tax=Flavihumibacter cheonanensis TaxID=1442385 RepID=UPI001EF78715|nr:TonB-dependent receptor [Flavihumibacter cheonanensis]MCG7753796.1 TonB-dependent receptor [Flavihumibacter cheonanensis]